MVRAVDNTAWLSLLLSTSLPTIIIGNLAPFSYSEIVCFPEAISLRVEAVFPK